MKKITALWLAAFSALGVQYSAADTLADVKAAGKLICGVLANNEPYAFQDPSTRQYVGYEVDLCQGVAKSLGVTGEIRPVSGDTRVPELLQGRVDVLTSRLSYTEERSKQVDFSNTYLADFFRCVVASKEIKTIDELADKRIGLTAGSTIEPLLKARFTNPQIVIYKDAPLLFLAVDQGKVDSGCNVTAQIANYLAKAPNSSLVMLDGAVGSQRIGFGVRKDNANLVDYLNDYLGKMEASGEAVALYDKWLGKTKVPREFKFTEPTH